MNIIVEELRKNSPLNWVTAKDESLASKGIWHKTDPNTGKLSIVVAGGYQLGALGGLDGNWMLRKEGTEEYSEGTVLNCTTEEAIELLISKIEES